MCQGKGGKSFSRGIHEGRGLMKMLKPKSPVPITLRDSIFYFLLLFPVFSIEVLLNELSQSISGWISFYPVVLVLSKLEQMLDHILR